MNRFQKIKEFFLAKSVASEPVAPYKIEAPVETGPAKCGCGRSQSGLCVGLHKLTPEEWATHSDNPNATKSEPKKKRTFVKRQDNGVAKVAAIKAKPKAPAKPKAKKPTK